MGASWTDQATAAPVALHIGTSGQDKPRRSRLRAVAAYVLSGLVMWVVYTRLSMTTGLNSDSANILLMGNGLLHGNLLLHSWWMSDVSFYPTELVQYALLVAVFGLHAQTAHIAAGMTYTLVFLLAVALARAGTTGRTALVRTLIAAGIMLAPSFGLGVFALDLSVGHIGTSVPLLLTWLLLDWNERAAGSRWWVPAVTAVLLAWVLMADPIVLVVGLLPLGVAATILAVRIICRADGPWLARLLAAWYPLSLIAAAGAAYELAGLAFRLVHNAGGYGINTLPFKISPWHTLHENVPAAWKVLEIFGANVAGLDGVQLLLAFLHMASIAVVLTAMVIAYLRYFKIGLIDQILGIAIVVNVALYMLTNASGLAAHEVAIIVPFGAVLAARRLTDTELAVPQLPSRARVAAAAVGIIVLAGYAAGLGWELAQPAQPMSNVPLATWLEEHHLTYGLSGYWLSSSVTIDSDGKVDVRALDQLTVQRDLWMTDEEWYDPAKYDANFIVLDDQPGYFTYWEPTALIEKYFGTPNKVYQYGQYTIEVWNHNLLPDIPWGHRANERLRPDQAVHAGQVERRRRPGGGHGQQPQAAAGTRHAQQDHDGHQVDLDERAHVGVEAVPRARGHHADLKQVSDEGEPLVRRGRGAPHTAHGERGNHDEHGEFEHPVVDVAEPRPAEVHHVVAYGVEGGGERGPGVLVAVGEQRYGPGGATAHQLPGGKGDGGQQPGEVGPSRPLPLAQQRHSARHREGGHRYQDGLPGQHAASEHQPGEHGPAAAYRHQAGQQEGAGDRLRGVPRDAGEQPEVHGHEQPAQRVVSAVTSEHRAERRCGRQRGHVDRHEHHRDQ